MKRCDWVFRSETLGKGQSVGAFIADVDLDPTDEVLAFGSSVCDDVHGANAPNLGKFRDWPKASLFLDGAWPIRR